MPPSEALDPRIASKFSVGDGCWDWTAGRFANGYGSLRLDGRHVKAHRAIYELLVGPIPEGMQLDHLCRNRACVNPAHLEPVTGQENIRRGWTARSAEASADFQALVARLQAEAAS